MRGTDSMTKRRDALSAHLTVAVGLVIKINASLPIYEKATSTGEEEESHASQQEGVSGASDTGSHFHDLHA